MSTNWRWPRLAVVDAAVWPVLVGIELTSIPHGGIFRSTLMMLTTVWMLVRMRRALGGGRQPYYLTTVRLGRWAFYWSVAMAVAAWALRHPA